MTASREEGVAYVLRVMVTSKDWGWVKCCDCQPNLTDEEYPIPWCQGCNRSWVFVAWKCLASRTEAGRKRKLLLWGKRLRTKVSGL